MARNTNSKSSNSKDLVRQAYNNPIIVKNEDGEYAPVGKPLASKTFLKLKPCFYSYF